MAQCVAVDPGTGALLVSSADPCTTLVILTPVEYGALASNPFVLSIEDGLLVSGAVSTLWLIAWAARAVRSVLSDGDSST